MSLEDKIDALTSALNRNSDLLEGLTAKAKTAQSTKTDEVKVEATVKPTEASKPADAKPAAKAEPAKRGRPAKAEKAPAPQDMADATKAFLEVDAEDEYNARREIVKQILAEFEAKKMSEIPEASRKLALDMLEAYKAGDDPFELLPKADAEEDLA